jgi:hypothetical protein
MKLKKYLLQQSKLILLLCLFFSTSISYGQIKVNPYLNKFIGTWRWTSGTDTLEIKLEKQVRLNLEVMVGWHKYVKNGIIIQSSYQHFGMNTNVDQNSSDLEPKITLGAFNNIKSQRMLFFTKIWDINYHQCFEGFLTLQANSLNQANFKISNPTGPNYSRQFNPLGIIYPKMPKNVVMTKL